VQTFKKVDYDGRAAIMMLRSTLACSAYFGKTFERDGGWREGERERGRLSRGDVEFQG